MCVLSRYYVFGRLPFCLSHDCPSVQRLSLPIPPRSLMTVARLLAPATDSCSGVLRWNSSLTPSAIDEMGLSDPKFLRTRTPESREAPETGPSLAFYLNKLWATRHGYRLTRELGQSIPDRMAL